MTFLKNRRKRKIFIAMVATVLTFAALFAACAVYLSDFYRAVGEAIEAFLPEGASYREEPNGNIVFEPQGAPLGRNCTPIVASAYMYTPLS